MGELAKTTVKGRKFTVILEKDEVDRGYSVQCLELPGAISQGETRDEALRNIKEAIELVLEALEAKARSKPGAEITDVIV